MAACWSRRCFIDSRRDDAQRVSRFLFVRCGVTCRLTAIEGLELLADDAPQARPDVGGALKKVRAGSRIGVEEGAQSQ